MKVFITIDTEEDTWDRYSSETNPVENISHLPRLQALFDAYRAIPTYLVNWPVATDRTSRAVLSDFLAAGGCEIGAHCHPWNTPPFEESLSVRNSMLSNLPAGLVKAKLENLHATLTQSFGVEPRCFRAGRWGYSPDVAVGIASLGYKVDTSVAASVDWAEVEGPDFSAAPRTAYRFHPRAPFTPYEDGPLLEVPPTIGFIQGDEDWRFALRRAARTRFVRPIPVLGILDRLGLLKWRWLSPEKSTGPELCALAQAFEKRGARYLNMSFHSNSMLPRANSFVRSAEDLEDFLHRIETFLKFVSDRGFEFRPLSDACHSL